MEFNESQLRALKARLESDLGAVNRLLAQNENEDVRRVRALLAIAQPLNVSTTNGHVTAKEVRDTILHITGQFTSAQVIDALNTFFHGREIPKGSVNTTIFR